ncbi:OsmC family protein [Massilia sp. S19_KUP03_FR1]|uniref:OsmC family protein n=1 Tax=Massilia sp. S19_KUP03_FR1 TaxID=3025503 RepID=UPI002FCD72F3
MKQFTARLAWRRGKQPFLDQRYSRAHTWDFDGGATVPASSSPLSVPLPMSDAAAVDPEEALVASVSSCHMLFFLSLAAQHGYIVDAYDDPAIGEMDVDADGKTAMTLIRLRPALAFSGANLPDAAAIAALHHAAHERCYIANSLKTVIVIEEHA